MNIQNYPELFYLTLTATATALFFIPYIGQLILQLGPLNALRETSGGQISNVNWAQRAKRAHYNAVENLVVFAPLAIIIHILGLSNNLTTIAAQIYFFSRIGHYLVYSLAIPYARTPLFAISWACQIALCLRIFGVL